MSWPAYPAYKDSSVKWIGEIPAAWSARQLRYICDVQTGDRDTVHRVDGGEFPFFIRSEIVQRIDSWSMDCEAVLTPGDGAVGQVFHHYIGKFDFHQRVYAFFNFQGIDGRYFYYYLSALFAKVALDGSAKTTVDSLRMPLIKGFVIAHPHLTEQDHIVRFLDRETAKIDSLIDKQEQLIATLREDRAATIAHAVTKGLNPDVEMKDSGVERLGHIPTHWTVPQIGWHSRVGNGSTPARDNQEYWLNGLVPWLNSGHVNRDRITDADQFVTNSAVLECHLPMVPAGSVLVGLTGQGKTRGMASLLMVPSTINQHLAYVTPISRQIGAAYLCYAIRSSYDYLREISEENGSTKGGLTCSALKKLRIPIPPKNEQDMLVRFLDERCSKIDSLIAKSTEMIDTLREYRSALITNAVTGKIDVREAV
ncbi:UNVERIFIED_ORG: type I restriction enzyme S subunit [Dietzia maris]|uniref:restriction endonuclease subunit S n=1 Tax=Dietzia maris TaxID=37915 RepID=UPI00104EFD19